MKLPAAVGVPESTPVVKFKNRPDGGVPENDVALYGAAPPVAEKVCVYGDPTVAAGSVAGVTVTVGQVELMVIV